MSNIGIDYGRIGQVNRNKKTGIHYGVINQNECLDAWADCSEPYSGDPTCPRCGNICSDYDAEKHADFECATSGCEDYTCEDCECIWDSMDVFGDEPLSWVLDTDEYFAESDDCGDIFITKSPYYTYAQFCSPCAPGAGHLSNPMEPDSGAPKSYCFSHDFFDNGKAPYRVFSVETNEEIFPDES